MAAPKKIIYYDVDRDYRSDTSGGKNGTVIRIGYQEGPEWRIVFGRMVSNAWTALDVSDAATWEAAIDDDFDSATDPMCRTLDANIDDSQAASGIIDVTLDADTATYETAIGTDAKKTAYFRLKGLNGSSKIIYRAAFDIVAENDIDPAGGVAPDPASSYYTKTEADARFAPIALDTETTLTDDATTNVTAFDKTTYRAAEIKATVDDGTSYVVFPSIVIYFVSSTAYVENLPAFIGDDFSATMSFGADISGDNVRLNVTMASHGSSPKMVYEIVHQFALSN